MENLPLGYALEKSNSELRSKLVRDFSILNEIIKPGFKYGEVLRKTDPTNFLAAAVLNKIYSINVSIENNLITNDVFLSVYLYRYCYELYIKIFYIFSDIDESITLKRVEAFLNNTDMKFPEYLQKISTEILPPSFKEDHKDKYQQLSRFVHPNIDSFNLHLEKSEDEIFAFIVPNVTLAGWHLIEILKLFFDKGILNLQKNLDKEKLLNVQASIITSIIKS